MCVRELTVITAFVHVWLAVEGLFAMAPPIAVVTEGVFEFVQVLRWKRLHAIPSLPHLVLPEIHAQGRGLRAKRECPMLPEGVPEVGHHYRIWYCLGFRRRVGLLGYKMGF